MRALTLFSLVSKTSQVYDALKRTVELHASYHASLHAHESTHTGTTADYERVDCRRALTAPTLAGACPACWGRHTHTRPGALPLSQKLRLNDVSGKGGGGVEGRATRRAARRCREAASVKASCKAMAIAVLREIKQWLAQGIRHLYTMRYMEIQDGQEQQRVRFKVVARCSNRIVAIRTSSDCHCLLHLRSGRSCCIQRLVRGGTLGAASYLASPSCYEPNGSSLEPSTIIHVRDA
eukprot:5234885-Pleurochrysis_carterae.AAC.1